MTHSIIFSKKRHFIFLAAIALPLFFSCCSSNNTGHLVSKKAAITKAKKDFAIAEPTKNQVVRFNESINIRFESKKNKIDSISATLDNKKLDIAKTDESNNFQCQGLPGIAGYKNINLKIFYDDSLTETHSIKILHLPNNEPQKIHYEVLRSFPHDPEAYTQGLLYVNGKLYESTGQQNRSSLREIDKFTGNILKKKNLPPQYFGEGIAYTNNKIFMLTYKARIGFVFNLDNFEIERQFELQTNEGWGLTTYNEDTILLTDGSPSLYFFLPDDYFTLTKQLEICNNKGLVNNLNELEYTPYGLFSNVYGTDDIYIIDVKQGIVTHALNLEALFPKDVPRDMDHVLNGIAYNKDKDTFYITGKQWTTMYEIKLSLN